MIVARSWAEVEAAAESWDAVPWRSEAGERECFAAAGGQPLALLDGDAALVGRTAERRLEPQIGYLRVPVPTLHVLRAVAVVGDARALVLRALEDVDAVTVPALPVDSVEFRSLAPLGGERFVRPWTRRRLVLPESFDAFLRSRSKKTRAGVRYDSKRLEAALTPDVVIWREWSDALAADLEHVARPSYQRRLGAGYSHERDAVLRVALAHGWARAYVLRAAGEPVAFWLCGVHGDTIRLDTTGYLAEHAQYRPGIYLLMRVIEDAIEDPLLRTLDFGPGRSDYKRHFSNDGYEEQNLVVFAPRTRAQAVRATRNAVGAAALGARLVLDRAGGTQRLKTAWRRRLRQ